MRQFTNLQESVIRKAQRALKKQPWYRGVCVNRVPHDHEIRAKGRHWAAGEIWVETYYHDGMY